MHIRFSPRARALGDSHAHMLARTHAHTRKHYSCLIVASNAHRESSHRRVLGRQKKNTRGIIITSQGKYIEHTSIFSHFRDSHIIIFLRGKIILRHYHYAIAIWRLTRNWWRRRTIICRDICRKVLQISLGNRTITTVPVRGIHEGAVRPRRQPIYRHTPISYICPKCILI